MDTELNFASVVIYVDDVPTILDFYRRAFGLEPKHYDETIGFAELGANGSVSLASHEAGEFMMPERYPRPPNDRRAGVEIAFWTTDVPAAFGRAVKAGAVAVTEPREMPWGMTVAYVESIEGTIVGFVTPMKEES